MDNHLDLEPDPDMQVQVNGSGPRVHLITDPTGSGTQPERDSSARKTCFSIPLHGLDTVLHLLQVGQIGLQQKLHLLQEIVQFTVQRTAAQLMAYWLKWQHSLCRIGSSSSTAYDVLAQVAAQLMAYWLK